MDYDAREHTAKPERFFYMFTLPANTLRRLCGIQRRSADNLTGRSADTGIQRRHNQERSSEIQRFVQFGFPWSSISAAQRNSGEYESLKKPGWLPTAVLVNILKDGDQRNGKRVSKGDVVTVQDSGSAATMSVPGSQLWRPTGLPPLEVIDGQHRLWSFDSKDTVGDEFELPVVAFHGLDISWQAYLFYTINIKPKKINTSLAYDLYPLLRNERWLAQVDGPQVYSETRAQELTETLWSHESSPWRGRIDMLGDRGRRQVSQAAWIRSLTSTMVKRWQAQRVQIGGLFGGGLAGAAAAVLPWTRPQQAAFLIASWSHLRDRIAGSEVDWTEALRDDVADDPNYPGDLNAFDAAFAGRHTLLNTDQGVRGVLYVLNDLCFVRSESLDLIAWEPDDNLDPDTSSYAVTESLRSLTDQPVDAFVGSVMAVLSGYDWRTASAPGLSSHDSDLKGRFRGSSGYRELRGDLLRHVELDGDDDVADAAAEVLDRLGLR